MDAAERLTSVKKAMERVTEEDIGRALYQGI